MVANRRGTKKNLLNKEGTPPIAQKKKESAGTLERQSPWTQETVLLPKKEAKSQYVSTAATN